MASGRYNTMSEGLQKVAQDLTMMMTTPDADLDWLAQMQTEVLKKMREPIDRQGGPFGASGPAPAGGGVQMPPEIAAMQGGGMPAGAGGIPMGGGGPPMPGSMPMPGAGAPSPDELARLLNM